MKCNYKILVMIFHLTSMVCFGQAVTIRGTIRDQITKQPVSYATVAVQLTTKGVSSDAQGKFNLHVTKNMNDAIVLISFIGYRTDTLKIIQGKLYYEVYLTPNSGSLNEVVVTGVSRATLARENPIPIISVSAQKIQATTESNVIDVLVKNVPGLNAVKTGPNISKPFIRGLGYNRVLTLYDGIRQEGQQWGDEHGIEVDAYNIDRAEVVKGPSSLIYGSDALAGVVGLIPAMPGAANSVLHGQFLSEHQSNNGLFGNGMRLTYARGHWGYALRGSYRIAKNYTNAVDGRVYNTNFRETNASGTLKYSNQQEYTTLNLTLYDNLQGIPDGSRDSLTRRFTYQTKEGNDDDVTARPIVPDNLLNSYQLSPLHQHIQHYRIYTKSSYRLGDGNIDGLLGFQQNIRREYNHPTDPEQAGMFVRLNTVNYGVNYNSPVLFNTVFSLGVNGMYQGNISKDATDFPIPNYHLFDAGLYGFAKWKHKHWTIGGGLRYDQRYLSGDNFYTRTNSQTGFNRRISSGIIGTDYLQFPAFDLHFSGLSLSLGSTYALSDRVSLKANIARGYRAPSITELASNGLDPGAHIIYLGNRGFQPEFSLQEDLGIEVSEKDFSATLSLFNNNISNYIYLGQLLDVQGNPITDAQGNKTYQYQRSKAQLYGLEATFSLQPEAAKGFSYNNAFTLNYAFNRDAQYKGARVQGEYLPLIPPLRLLSSVNQDFKLGNHTINSMNVKIEADINGTQHRYLGLNETETATSGYTLVNAGVGAIINYSRSHTLQLLFQINNLFNTTYQYNLNRLKYFEYYAASPNGKLGIYNIGRNICLKAIIPF